MTPKRLLEFIGIEPLQNSAHRGVSWRPSQRRVRKSRIEQGEPRADQDVDFPIRPSAAQHGDNRKQDDADLAVNLSFGA
jgi:hypothetical protein